MMNTYTKTILIVLFCFSISSFAQTVVKRDTISGTELVIEMDTPILAELNSAEKECKLKKKNAPKYTSNRRRPTRRTGVKRTITQAELCRRNPKIWGAKILVGVRRSYREANALKAKFRKTFRMKAITDASLRPNFKVLAGSYKRIETGKKDLRKVKRVFPSAVLVKYQVYCAEAK